MYILLAILIFGFLIFIHELGHFLTAKLSGVQVNEFSLCMGPVLWQRTRGETTYSLRCIPIGGFCAMEGEDEESDNPRAFTRARVWKKLLILAAGSFMNFLTGLVLVLILLSEVWPAQSGGTEARSAPDTADFSSEMTLEQRLEALIGQVEGAGRTKVMVTLETGAQSVYAVDTREGAAESGQRPD